MAAVGTTRIRLIDSWTLTNDDSISVPTDQKDYIVDLPLTDGNGDNQFQEQFKIQATIAPGSDNADSYDLAGGVTNFAGQTITFATIKEILLVNAGTTSGDDLVLGGSYPTTGNLLDDIFGGSSDPRIKIKAGGHLLLTMPLTGYTCTGGSADILIIENIGANSVTYDLIVKGTGTAS